MRRASHGAEGCESGVGYPVYLLVVSAVLLHPPGDGNLMNRGRVHFVWVQDAMPVDVVESKVKAAHGLHDFLAKGRRVVAYLALGGLAVLGQAKSGEATEERPVADRGLEGETFLVLAGKRNEC